MTRKIPEIYIYIVDLPPGVKEMVCPSGNSYTIYLDAHQNRETQENSLKHALSHIANNDWEKVDVQAIEHDAHNRKDTPENSVSV